MKKNWTLIMLINSVIWLAACQVPFQYAARRLFREVHGIRYDAFAVQPLPGDLGKYQQLWIAPLRNEMEDEIPAELVKRLDEQLFQQVRWVKQFDVIRADRSAHAHSVAVDDSLSGKPNGGRATVSISAAESSVTFIPAPSRRPFVLFPEPSERRLILRSAIVDFHPGIQALRVLQIGVGREAVLTLHLWFVDGATGQVLGKYVVNSEVYRMPADSRAAVNKLARGVGQLVARLIETKRSRHATHPRSQHRVPNSRRSR
ncbi:MAG: hypothetical protein D6723_11080 [Acidobacteria bacterium]|nr:MAG: hypothetical protein D6723_11080 [Acidobacteriota bacterium]